MAIDRKLQATAKVDFAAIGYAAVREAFNETLELCIGKLSKAEIRLAEDLLEVGPLDDGAPGIEEMLKDTALYSRKSKPGVRRAKRAIDRVAEKLLRLHDPLKSAIATRLPGAVFSIFRLEQVQEPGIVLAYDMLDGQRPVTIMDNSLAAMVDKLGEILIAGRFVDLGPWHVGFGIVVPLRKSEALAIGLTLANEDNQDNRRDDLHELIYVTELHDENLVMAALEPVILALSLAIDQDMIDPEDFMTSLGSSFSNHADDESALRTLAP